MVDLQYLLSKPTGLPKFSELSEVPDGSVRCQNSPLPVQ
jgi:hypothetical protein